MSYHSTTRIDSSRTARLPGGRRRASSSREISPADTSFSVFSTTKPNADPLIDGTDDTAPPPRRAIGQSAGHLSGGDPGDWVRSAGSWRHPHLKAGKLIAR